MRSYCQSILILFLFIGASSLLAQEASSKPQIAPVPNKEKTTNIPAKSSPANPNVPDNESNNPDETKKEELTDEQTKQLEALAESSPELKSLLEKLKSQLKDFDAIVLSIPELKDFFEKQAKPAAQTIIDSLNKETLKRLGVDKATRDSSLPQGFEVSTPEVHEKQDRILTPEFNIAQIPLTPPSQVSSASESGRGCRHSRGGQNHSHSGGGASSSSIPLVSREIDPSIPLDRINPRQFVTSGKLVPANINGKKSFEIISYFNGFAEGHCQATLFVPAPNAKSDSCQMATAQHCVLNDRDLKKATHYQTAYGMISADKVEILGGSNAVANDMAYISFKGATCEKMREEEVPEVPLCSTSLTPGDYVSAETRYFEKPIFGITDNVLGSQISIDVNFSKRDSGSHQGGIHTGDSGGGLFKKSPTGEACLAGVLSAANKSATTHRTRDGRPTIGSNQGFYSGAIDFLRTKAARTQQREPRDLLAGR